MKRQSHLQKKPINVLEDVEKLKQRREERKIKNNEEKKEDKENNQKYSGKYIDTEYENLMKRRKIEFNMQPTKVIYCNKKYY
jgi:hypothetical protein